MIKKLSKKDYHVDIYTKADITRPFVYWFLSIFRNILLKNGKKQKAEKIIQYIFYRFKKLGQVPIIFFQWFLYRFRPVVNTRKTYIGRRRITYPVIITPKKSLNLLVRWLISCAISKVFKKRNFQMSLFRELSVSFSKKSTFNKLRADYFRSVLEAKPFISDRFFK